MSCRMGAPKMRALLILYCGACTPNFNINYYKSLRDNYIIQFVFIYIYRVLVSIFIMKRPEYGIRNAFMTAMIGGEDYDVLHLRTLDI